MFYILKKTFIRANMFSQVFKETLVFSSYFSGEEKDGSMHQKYNKGLFQLPVQGVCSKVYKISRVSYV